MSKISIVTPSYNQGRYIIEALESVRQQDYLDLEHLLFDGGSADSTVSLLEGLAPAEWPQLRWTSGRDGGQSEALNRGFREARGDIIGWLNSDDRYREGCFEHVCRAFEEHPEVDVFYGDYTWIDEDGALVKVRREIEFNRFILAYHHVLFIPSTATFFRRRIFDEGNWLRDDLHYAMDYEFFLRLDAKGYRIKHLPHVLADFRLHRESKSCSMEVLQSRERLEILNSFTSVTRYFKSKLLRRLILRSFQICAGILRWSEKLMRGGYSIQYFRSTSNRSST